MAGINPDGGAAADAEFRADIRETMVMGLPPLVALRPTFYFPSDDTFLLAATSGAPWVWTDTPIANDDDREPVLVPCAVEVGGTSVALTSLGTFNPEQVVLSICDVDYALVRGFHEVKLGGVVYRYTATRPPVGLFSFTLHQIEVQARDRP